MKLIDVHCHLESEHFRNNLDTVLKDAREASVAKLITSSITPTQWELSKSIAEKYDEASVVGEVKKGSGTVLANKKIEYQGY